MSAEGWRVDGPAEVIRPRPVVGRLLQRLARRADRWATAIVVRLDRWSTVTVIDDHGQP